MKTAAIILSMLVVGLPVFAWENPAQPAKQNADKRLNQTGTIGQQIDLAATRALLQDQKHRSLAQEEFNKELARPNPNLQILQYSIKKGADQWAAPAADITRVEVDSPVYTLYNPGLLRHQLTTNLPQNNVLSDKERAQRAAERITRGNEFHEGLLRNKNFELLNWEMAGGIVTDETFFFYKALGTNFTDFFKKASPSYLEDYFRQTTPRVQLAFFSAVLNPQTVTDPALAPFFKGTMAKIDAYTPKDLHYAYQLWEWWLRADFAAIANKIPYQTELFSSTSKVTDTFLVDWFRAFNKASAESANALCYTFIFMRSGDGRYLWRTNFNAIVRVVYAAREAGVDLSAVAGDLQESLNERSKSERHSIGDLEKEGFKIKNALEGKPLDSKRNFWQRCKDGICTSIDRLDHTLNEALD